MSRWWLQGLLVVDCLLWEVPVPPKNVRLLLLPQMGKLTLMNGAGAGVAASHGRFYFEFRAVWLLREPSTAALLPSAPCSFPPVTLPKALSPSRKPLIGTWRTGVQLYF